MSWQPAPPSSWGELSNFGRSRSNGPVTASWLRGDSCAFTILRIPLRFRPSRTVPLIESDSVERIALRDLVERYALAVDARDIDAVVRLYTEDGVMLSHLMPGTEVKPFERRGHEQLRRALELGLAQYKRTTHLIGGQVIELEGEDAEGTTVCLAHHVYGADDGDERLLVMAIRYDDRYTKEHGLWRFAERLLRLEWREDRPLIGGGRGETR